MYENVKRENALDYGDLAYSMMLDIEGSQTTDEPDLLFKEAAFYLADYDQEHVNAAIYWPDESVTIHSRIPNNIYEIFERIDGCLDCPVYAKGIRIAPFSLCQDDMMLSFTIWLNPAETNDADGWNDPKSFFLKYANKDLHFSPSQQPAQTGTGSGGN